MFPSFDALHPLVVHFPIALLVVAPLIGLIGLVMLAKKCGCAPGFLFAALLLLALGEAGALVSVKTGEAAEHYVKEYMKDGGIETKAAKSAMLDHEAAARNIPTVFGVLTLLYAGLVIYPLKAKKEINARLLITLHVVYWVLFIGALFLLARAAHLGGLLVHQHGVTAPL